MTQKSFKRKLTAILSADAVGYSRLMRQDEAATVATLKEHKKTMALLIDKYRGRVVDSPGDNVLAEFGSVVDAVECAVEIQKELKAKNEDLPDDSKMEFRIGIHLGDVLEEEDRIYGDGVNIAARIEGLAESGGICISRTTYDSVKDKLTFGYEYLGEHTVKNIAVPVRVYQVLLEPEAAGKVIGEKRFLGRISRRTAIAAIIILVIVAGGLIGWNIYLHQSKKVKPASLDKMAFPLPDKPSIAVLPFDNLSGDPDQEYFSDGLTEEIISGLSKVPFLFVIARNSSFTYKGKPVKVQEVSEELGARYVLEGSVRKEGNRVRITAQLIDAISGHHIWSERYDRELKDIFELQDEIMRNILAEMQIQLTDGVQAQLYTKKFQEKKIGFEVFEKHMQSLWYFYRMNPEGFSMARQLAEEAIEIDPNYAPPYTVLAFIHLADIRGGRSKSPRKSMAFAEKYAQKALQLDDSHPMARITLGQIHLYKRQHEKAIAEGKKALALSPNGADVHSHLGYFLYYAGRYEEAIPLYEKAIRLNPYPPIFYYLRLGSAYANVGRYDEAIDLCKKTLKQLPNSTTVHLVLAMVYIWQGREEEAHAEVAEVLRINPSFTLRRLKAVSLHKNKEDLKRRIEALCKAGLPE